MKIERLGGIINSYLYNNNIKTKEFARKSDLSETYIRDILHEKKISPSINTLALISKGLDISLEELLERLGIIRRPGPKLTSIDDYNKNIELLNLLLINNSFKPLDSDKLSEIEIMEISDFLNAMLYFISKYTN